MTDRDRMKRDLAEMTARCEARPDISREDARLGAVDCHEPGSREAYMRVYRALRKHAGEEG